MGFIGNIPLAARTGQSPEELRKLHATNESAFERGWRQNPRGEGGNRFPSWESCLVDRRVADLVQPEWPKRTGVDLSSKARPGTCLFTVTRNPISGVFIPVEIIRGRWTGPQILMVMQGVWARHGAVSRDFSFNVEDNGLQGWIIEWVTSDYDSSGRRYDWEKKVFPISTQGYNKHDEESGLPSLEVEYKNMGWQIPHREFSRHRDECECGWCYWRREVKTYPACYGDTVMAGWFGREGFSRKKSVAKRRFLHHTL